MLMLSIADYVITAAAVSIVAVTAVRWSTGSPPPLSLREGPARPNRFREDSVVLAICAYLLAAALLGGVIGLFVENAEDVRVTLAVNNGAHFAAIAACLLIARQQFGGGVRAFCFGRTAILPPRAYVSGRDDLPVGPRRDPAGIRRTAAITVCLAVVAVDFCPLIRDATMKAVLAFDAQYEFAAHPTIAALREQPHPVWIVVALWLGAVLVAPLAEELFFRGIVQTFLVGLIQHRWAAVALTSLTFGLVHFQQVHAIPALVVLGILIGYSYERTGSLLPPVVIHAVFNLKTLIWYAFATQPTIRNLAAGVTSYSGPCTGW